MEKFTLKEAISVKKMGLRALRFVHNPTGLVHVHIERPCDANRVFSLAFRTNAPDRTGVPHILEHTTLCGSEKFPVRDPFFKMLSRSLANFMNAMTGADYTFYPFATTNKADFHNLQRVYMDSVFKPLLKEQDFLQEGWRLEPVDLKSPVTVDNPLTFKGVVYNEMKGQISVPAYQHYTSWLEKIYPAIQCSGGDPLDIPDLKYMDLVRFHREHYHPSNCFTFSYGDFKAEEAIQPLLEYLEDVKPLKSVSKPLEPLKLEKSSKCQAKGPVDPMFDLTKQHKISLTWVVGGSDLQQTMVWRVLSMLLIDGHASPLHQALIDSGIGTEFSVNSGLEETSGALLFTVGLQGISESQIPQFKKAVRKALNEVSEKGFPQHRVNALLHQAELSNREVDAGFGMSMLSRLVSRAFHQNNDVMQLVDAEKQLLDFQTLLENDPELFKSQIREHLNESAPCFEFELTPSTEYESERSTAEGKKLESVLNALSAEEKEKAVVKAKELEQAANQPQDLDLLPTVTTRDIAVEPRNFPIAKSEVSGIPYISRDTGTQGISYVRMLRELKNFPSELIPFLPIYADAVSSVGTEIHEMAELEDLIKLNTGNLGVGAAYRSWGSFELAYGASALDSKLPEMYALFKELFTLPKLNNIPKLKVLLDSSAQGITNSLSQNGHRYACMRAAASISASKATENLLGGLPFVQLVQKLAAVPESDFESSLVPKLQKIQDLPWDVRCAAVTHTGEQQSVHKEEISKFFGDVNANPAGMAPQASNIGLWRNSHRQQGKLGRFSMVPVQSFQVSHVGAAVTGCLEALTNKDHASLQVLANLATHKFLHTEIREKGGAYGGGASYSSVDGIFSMYSYRDPTPQNSRDVMDKVGKWATNHKFSERDVEEGKIGIFQSLDAPLSPRSEISRHLGLQATQSERRQVRENLLNVTPNDLNAAAEKYLGDNAYCIIGPGEVPDGWTSE